MLGAPRLGGAVGKGPARHAPPAVPGAAVGAADAERYVKVVDALQPDGHAATRGAKDTEVYEKASPAVVLVISSDSLGSGALVSADGLIITNLHVVGAEKEVGVVFKPATEGEKLTKADVRRAKVVRVDEVADLALLQVSEVPQGVTPLVVGGIDEVQVGADVHAIGHPTGEAWSYTRGIVSQIRRDYAWHAQDRIDHKATVIQTQTPINPGNSGGPLLDDQMHIIGINSFSSEGEGLNFAVSADDVKALLARKDDRLVEAPAKKGAAQCKTEELDQRRAPKDDGDVFLLDFDCDGKGDAEMFIADNKKDPDLLLMDDDGDGKIDTVIVDKNHDGDFDYALYDTDGNGKPDMMGKYHKGEDEPYRYERIKEKG